MRSKLWWMKSKWFLLDFVCKKSDYQSTSSPEDWSSVCLDSVVMKLRAIIRHAAEESFYLYPGLLCCFKRTSLNNKNLSQSRIKKGGNSVMWTRLGWAHTLWIRQIFIPISRGWLTNLDLYDGFRVRYYIGQWVVANIGCLERGLWTVPIHFEGFVRVTTQFSRSTRSSVIWALWTTTGCF